MTRAPVHYAENKRGAAPICGVWFKISVVCTHLPELVTCRRCATKLAIKPAKTRT